MIYISEEKYNNLVHKGNVLDKLVQSKEELLIGGFLDQINDIVSESSVSCEDSLHGLYIINVDESSIRNALLEYSEGLMELSVTYRGLIL